MSDKSQLLSFGFSEAKASRALAKTKNSGLQPALDWLLEHQDDPEPTAEELEAEANNTKLDEDEEGAPGGLAEAKSLKCLECGKVFRNNALASYHGEKSGHDQFEESTEEIKPLTEEEKSAKLQELKSRMQEKKAINARKEAEEAKSNERMRRKGGQDESQIKAELALKEANKEALERKADKLADAKAKAAVRQQIEADKRARADKAAREKALRDGNAPPPPSADPAPVVAARAAGEKKVYDQTRLQIRLPSGGQPLVHSMSTSATLADLIAWTRDQPSAAGLEKIVFSSTFPRKTFGSADEQSTLAELGLSPSAVLLLQ